MKPSRFGVAFFVFGALAGASAVALAAFAVHGLSKVAPNEKAVRLFEQATSFQMNHTLALVFVTLASERVTGTAQTLMRISAALMALSILLFPGALYSQSFNGPGFFAPFGGLASMLGWLMFGIGTLATLRGAPAVASTPGLRPHPAE